MRKSTSILIEEDFDAFIDQQIAAGRFESAGEVVEAGLRLLRRRDEELEELRTALIEGEESGIAEDFDNDLFLKQMREKHAAQGIGLGSLPIKSSQTLGRFGVIHRDAGPMSRLMTTIPRSWT